MNTLTFMPVHPSGNVCVLSCAVTLKFHKLITKKYLKYRLLAHYFKNHKTSGIKDQRKISSILSLVPKFCDKNKFE